MAGRPLRAHLGGRAGDLDGGHRRLRSARRRGARGAGDHGRGQRGRGALAGEFLQGLVGRGLRGVQLVNSDAHRGLVEAIAQVFVGASWQRCTVHFLRNVEARVPKSDQSMVRAAVGSIFK